jgi:hypothetical protein
MRAALEKPVAQLAATPDRTYQSGPHAPVDVAGSNRFCRTLRSPGTPKIAEVERPSNAGLAVRNMYTHFGHHESALAGGLSGLLKELADSGPGESYAAVTSQLRIPSLTPSQSLRKHPKFFYRDELRSSISAAPDARPAD